MVEPRTVNALVGGSSPSWGAKYNNIVLHSNIDNVSKKIYVPISQLDKTAGLLNLAMRVRILLGMPNFRQRKLLTAIVLAVKLSKDSCAIT